VVIKCGESLAVELENSNLFNVLGGEALVVGGNQCALAVAERDDNSTEFNDLERGILSNVS
jgi:hypothetical protein